jgi:hypothetical protein
VTTLKRTLKAILLMIILSGALLPAAATEGAMSGKPSFNESDWSELKQLMEAEGAAAVVERIRAVEDAEERRALFLFAHQGFAYQDWEGKNLDDLATVVRAGIDEFLAQAEAAGNADARAKLIDGANVEAYNLAADLAPCWPGDELPREPRHFELGVELGERMLSWREDLDKGPDAFSMAHWALGIHQLFLGEADAAATSFQSAVDYAARAAREGDRTAECVPGGDFSVVLNTGYRGLALSAAGDDAGRELYNTALAAFEGTIADYPEQADDARFGIDQLKKVASGLGLE